jgi:hypothetical protein
MKSTAAIIMASILLLNSEVFGASLDVDNDGKTGLPEAIYSLQVAAGVQPPIVNCHDSEKNGPETDVDCGGSCTACVDGKTCSTAADCMSRICTNNICQAATCADGAKNGLETDIDCGVYCSPCGDAEACIAAIDCSSHVCTKHLCTAPTCNDGVKNGTEADIDCGGLTCPPVAMAKHATPPPIAPAGYVPTTSVKHRPVTMGLKMVPRQALIVVVSVLLVNDQLDPNIPPDNNRVSNSVGEDASAVS